MSRWKVWLGAAVVGVGLSLAAPVSAQEPGSPSAEAALDEAATLAGKAHRLIDGARYAEALSVYQRALALREKALGPEHEDIAKTLNNMAAIHRYQGDYARAAQLFQRALSILEKRLDPLDPGLATAMDNLSVTHGDLGDYTRAEPLGLRALALREKVLGPEHPHVAQSLNNVAIVYDDLGDYARAEPLYLRALAIREKALGPDDPDTATSLNNLAALYLEKGDPARAEPLNLRALAIREKVLEPEHPDIAQSLDNLAAGYYAKGDYARAERSTRRALAIREKVLGPDHPDVAKSLSNLATRYDEGRDYARAEPLYRRSLAILEKAFGPDHPTVAVSLDNLARLYGNEGEAARAEPLYRRSLAIQEKALAPEHPDRALTLSGLARSFRQKGEYARAEPLYRQALSIREKLGFDHYDTSADLLSLASLRALAADPAFVPLLERGETMGDRLALPILATGSEQQKRLYMDVLTHDSAVAVSLELRVGPKSPAATRVSLTTLLRRKGRILDAMADTFATLRRHLGPEVQALLDQLSAIVGELATQISRGPGKIPLDAYRRKLASLEAKRQVLEGQIGARSAEFHADQQLVSLDQVQAAIPEGAALLELYRYQPVAGSGAPEGQPRYAAYLLRRHGDPSSFDLGEALPIDAAAQALRKALGDPDLTHDPKPAARALDARVMQPLRAALGDTRWILLSPDGELTLVPFEALTDEQGHYLVERRAFTYLTTGRDLLRFTTEATPVERPLLVGDPAFDVQSGAPPGDQGRNDVSRGLRSMAMLHGPFERLSDTGNEVRAVARLFPEARVLLGPSATEGALKAAHAPLFLHLSTHGFYLPEESGSPRQAENPLLRSGVLLAGADQRRSGDDDGILTALEASNLDLHGTRLAVLATCDSGLGQAVSGEGVYGLRRALIMAGSATQVMSLWQVSSKRTEELMTAYYTRLGAGEGRSEAMRQVELGMLARKETAHPHLWAAFIVSGSSASLDGRPMSADRIRVGPGPRGCACSEAGGGAPGAGGIALSLGGLLLAARTRRRGRRASEADRPRRREVA